MLTFRSLLTTQYFMMTYRSSFTYHSILYADLQVITDYSSLIAGVASAMGLLRLPKMPELKALNGGYNGQVTTTTTSTATTTTTYLLATHYLPLINLC